MEWINVEDRLPRKGKRVITCMKSDYYYGEKVVINRLVTNKDWAVGCGYCPVILWQPLPEPPTNNRG